MKEDEAPWLKDWIEQEEIERGGQGIITKLIHKTNKAQWAVLKRIVTRWQKDPQARKRLQQEAETLLKLHNLGARVPEVFDSFLKHDAAEPFLLMEFIKGVRFDEWLKSSAPVAPAKAVLVTNGIVQTIKLCHQHKIGHRDLKPSNIILKNGEIRSPYVLDFGIAFDSRQTRIITKEGEMFWNEFIILPECQDLEGGHRDFRSDITALAGIFFTCLTGRPPIVLRNAQELAPHQKSEKLLRDSAETIEQGERLIWFFDRAFKYRIDERFQTLDEFIAELNHFDESSPVVSLDLFEQFNVFDESLRATDRNVQLSGLRQKYTRLLQKVNKHMQKELDRLRHKHGQPSQIFIPINRIHDPFRPKLDGGDLLDKVQLQAFTVRREDFQHMAVVAIASFAVGMEIHLYSASWCASSGRPEPTKLLKWSKIATLDERANDLTETKLTVIVETLKSKLAHEIRNLVPRKK